MARRLMLSIPQLIAQLVSLVTVKKDLVPSHHTDYKYCVFPINYCSNYPMYGIKHDNGILLLVASDTERTYNSVVSRPWAKKVAQVNGVDYYAVDTLNNSDIQSGVAASNHPIYEWEKVFGTKLQI